jgi:hypothetical protein
MPLQWRMCGLGPATNSQVIDVGQRPRCPGNGDGFERGVEVQVAAVRSVALAFQLADAPRPRRPTAGQVEHQPAGKPLGQSTQLRVSCAGEIRQHRQRLIGVLVHRFVKRSFVELADFR